MNKLKLNKFIELHKWFCKTSRKYCGVGYGKIWLPFNPGTVAYGPKYKFKDFCYFPIAWFKFMKLCVKEFWT